MTRCPAIKAALNRARKTVRRILVDAKARKLTNSSKTSPPTEQMRNYWGKLPAP